MENPRPCENPRQEHVRLREELVKGSMVRSERRHVSPNLLLPQSHLSPCQLMTLFLLHWEKRGELWPVHQSIYLKPTCGAGTWVPPPVTVDELHVLGHQGEGWLWSSFPLSCIISCSLSPGSISWENMCLWKARSSGGRGVEHGRWDCHPETEFTLLCEGMNTLPRATAKASVAASPSLQLTWPGCHFFWPGFLFYKWGLIFCTVPRLSGSHRSSYEF